MVKNVIDVSDALAIVDKLSTIQLGSPITNDSVSFANSPNLKLFWLDTTQTVSHPQWQQHLT